MLYRLKTIPQRFFAIALFLIISGAAVGAYSTEKVIGPTRWYFFTTEGDRCEFLRTEPMANPFAAEYRGVRLCNTANVLGEVFAVRRQYFESRVDQLYSQYYRELVEHYFLFLGAALLVWFALLVGWMTFRGMARVSPTT